MTQARVEEAWARIERWCQAHAPEALAALGGPATPAAVAAVEEAIGAALPADFRAWLALHASSGYRGPFTVELLKPEAALDTWRLHEELHPPGADAHDLVTARHHDRGVRRLWWSRGWYPFTSDGAGDALCVDLDPASGGDRGQIIAFLHDHEERRVVASSFGAWLEAHAAALESGAIVATEHDRSPELAGLLRRESLKGDLVTVKVRGEAPEDRRARIVAYYAANPAAVGGPLLSALRAEGKVTGDRLGALMAVAKSTSDAAPHESSNDEARRLWKALRAAPGVISTASPWDILRVAAAIRAGEGS